ncbi:MAG: ribonuclease HII [Rickettsiaceae bacterium]|nr:ribonuclease HII [Rickettsiaceae bacterium]
MADFLLEDEYNGLLVAGVDEAGRGPLMGPVFASAVIVDRSLEIPGINDSKKLSEKRREELFEQIINHYKYGIGFASAEEIDKINILEATKLACKRAVGNLPLAPEVVLIDGNMKFSMQNYISVIKGDLLSISIAAASILAKVSRDRLINELAKSFPEYGWEKNKGYGTKSHMEAIAKFGLTIHHRQSFCKNLTNPE